MLHMEMSSSSGNAQSSGDDKVSIVNLRMLGLEHLGAHNGWNVDVCRARDTWWLSSAPRVALSRRYRCV